MGLLLTLLLPIFMFVLSVVRPRAAFYLLLATFVLLDELGPGFTTYRGSLPFNASMAGIFGVRLIEIVTMAVYVGVMAFNRRSLGAALAGFDLEKLLLKLFVAWIVILSLAEFLLTKSVKYSDWRLIASGVMQFHLMLILFADRAAIEKLLRVFLVLLVIKAAYGLLMFAAGFGVQTPRGRLPFFWDSKQVEAFGLGALILFAYLLNYAGLAAGARMLRPQWATVMLVLLLAAVLGSIRRTIWITTLLGMLVILVVSRRTTIIHYFTVVAVVAMTVAALLLAPGLETFRDHMGKYVESLNIFDDSQRRDNIENDVHFDNVKQYYKLITDNPDILMLGIHGTSGSDLAGLTNSYSEGGYRLGMAHNGLLRSILFFGVVGGLFYLVIFFRALTRTILVAFDTRDNDIMKHAAVACGVLLVLQYSASFFFVPPFYTSSKGLFYTFLEMFFLFVLLKPESAVAPGVTRQYKRAFGIKPPVRLNRS